MAKPIDNKIQDSNNSYELAGRNHSFAVIAVRCNSGESTGRKKLEPMRIYYLLDGYSVEEGKKYLHARGEIDVLYDDFLDANSLISPHVIVSAIVGQNGAGKSSLVEFIMRLLNNFAAVTFGETKSMPSAERLHYIEGVDGDLWYEKNGSIFQLSVKDRVVTIHRLEQSAEGLNAREIYSSEKTSNKETKDTSSEIIFLRISDDALKSIYINLFYTVVTNFSIYAYNTTDYRSEDDSLTKTGAINGLLKKIRDEGYINYDDSHNWLEGIFHKNDGYQVPLVLTPFRDQGNIDINKENSLAKERLISLMTHFENFRIINGHLKAISLTISQNLAIDYGPYAIRSQFKMNNLTQNRYDNLRRQIALRWGEILDFKFLIEKDEPEAKPYHNLALDYLTYKSIKVAASYRQHNAAFLKLCDSGGVYDEMLVNEMVNSLATDFSHVTRKIFQTLAYIMGDVYSDGIIEGRPYELDFKEIEDRYIDNYHEIVPEDFTHTLFVIRSHVAEQSVIPPPFLESRINLCELKDESGRIAFESLSSGERQIAYAVSSILYHLDNLNSVRADGSDELRINYQDVFLVLEEVELYFHPELQQGLIKYILEGMRQLFITNIKGIHILFVTHSPYVLSDIPRQNVLALNADGSPSERKLNSFCGNIHEMLEDSFFLSNGSQGLFAQWEVGRIMACIKVHQKCNGKRTLSLNEIVGDDEADEESMSLYQDLIERYGDPHKKRKVMKLDYARFCSDFSIDQLKQRIALIDEPVIRAVMEHELNTAIAKDNDMRLARIEELEAELSRLKNLH